MLIQTKPNPLTWQQTLAQGVSDAKTLLAHLALDHHSNLMEQYAQHQFPLRVPWGFVQRMEKGNPSDPLLLQVLPSSAEMQIVPGYHADPLQEKNYNPLPGLLHKYQGRVLLTLSGACAINCRYCFRRHFPYKENQLGAPQRQAVIDYINNDPSIYEVILSGGDPLLTSDIYLEKFIQSLATIKHLSLLRIHSRIPIVLPERITPEFCNILNNSRLQCVLVTHCNHPNEIDETVQQALKRLIDHQIVLLNQSVLLKNINDDAAVLGKLSKVLFANRVMPYYLHLLDPVQGAAHFDVPLATAKQLITTMLAELPGYLIPKLVQEKPGKAYKQPQFLCTQ